MSDSYAPHGSIGPHTFRAPRSRLAFGHSLALCMALCAGPALMRASAADASSTAATAATADSGLSFFITSVGLGKGANLGGLAGADAHCQSLAAAVGAGDRTWRAYLSTQAANGTPAVNARDRIGAGPWYNAKGVRVAAGVEDLHGPNNKLSKENSLTEKGDVVNGRGDNPNQHDMLTGSKADGTAFPAGTDQTCQNWTSETTGAAMLGHHDRHGVASNIDSTSWNQAHLSSGCSQSALIGTGGNGYFYCFAADGAVGLNPGRPARESNRLSGFLVLPGGRVADRPLYRLDLAEPSEVKAEVFTLAGRPIASLASGVFPAGRHELRWNGLGTDESAVSRGFFLLRVTTSPIRR